MPSPAALRRRSTFVVPLLAVGVIVTACGGGGDDVALSGPEAVAIEGRLPESFHLAQVIAGDGEGWVLGTDRAERSGTLSLWRWEPGRPPEQLGEVPDGIGADGTGFDGGVALAGVTCDDEAVPEDGWREECDRARARVVILDDAGEVVASTTLWENVRRHDTVGRLGADRPGRRPPPPRWSCSTPTSARL